MFVLCDGHNAPGSAKNDVVPFPEWRRKKTNAASTPNTPPTSVLVLRELGGILACVPAHVCLLSLPTLDMVYYVVCLKLLAGHARWCSGQSVPTNVPIWSSNGYIHR